MKNSRRILCLFLALCVVSVCPLNALAVSDNGENMEISGEQVYIVRQGELLAGDYEILADGEWTFVERTEHTITWEQATGTAVVTYLAGQIAGKVPFLTPYAAKIAIGTGVLSIIAASCNQAKVVVEFYTLTFPGQPIQYMYKWTFTPSGGSTYGPYRIVIDNQVASIGDPDELQ